MSSLAPIVVVVAVPSALQAEPCERAAIEVAQQAGEEVASVGESIRLESAQVGRPWACRGGTVTLEPAEGGFRVTVSRGASSVSRVVATSSEIRPLALALLSLPDLPARTAEEPPPVSSAPPAPLEPVAAVTVATSGDAAPSGTAESSTRVELKLLADVRIAVPSDVVLLGPQLGVAFPLETPGWLVFGGWLRFGAPIATLERGPGFGEADAGVTVGARFAAGPVELRVDLGFGGAVLFRDLPRPEGSVLLGAPRLVTRFCGAGPTDAAVRPLVCVGADGTIPIGAERDRSSAPLFAAGLGAGVEWAL